MSIEDDLKPTISDHIHSAISVAASISSPLLPGVGELFNWLVAKPINDRRDYWIIQMEHRLQALEAHGLKYAELQKNEEFISAVLYASSIAIRNHGEEKRIALLNAITNIAIHEDLNETKYKIFLNYIDTFTEWHLKILSYFENPMQRFIEASIAIPIADKFKKTLDYFFLLFPDKEISNELITIIADDLYSKNLIKDILQKRITITHYDDTEKQPIESHLAPQLTTFGREFVDFIKNIE